MLQNKNKRQKMSKVVVHNQHLWKFFNKTDIKKNFPIINNCHFHCKKDFKVDIKGTNANSCAHRIKFK